ncbi:branched-chain amino acid ABC transporter permease [Nocardioides sp. LMS-CY]|uniref:Branched-chain amino acid transport system permease protein n=1 Tax=Nocardioides soli TaxID=1036020 RepID=A0A7W4VRV7_9ACTN|nr:branched-chain amino acid ABC transporter permease [Nocardioides sp. LMS-CY]MBB3040630.1 branched-chain amino acid transport system permease protein [Nocardioides soli]QWF23912.1 branched-chain amino acid ABC transporter permease [Nocardioides sp. LMS-CY]
MDTGLFIQVILSGLSVGAIYALVAVGFGVVFNATGAINFVQGEYVMVGGLSAGMLYEAWDVPVLVAILVAIALTTLLGVLTEMGLLGFGRLRTPASITIATIAIAVVVKGAAMLISNRDTFALPSLLGPGSLQVLGASTSRQTLLNLLLAVLAVAALTLFFQRTKLGTTLRAAASDSETLQTFGVSYRTTARWAFAIAAAVGALAGAGLAPLTVMSFDSGTLLGLKGFAAAMLGGLGNPRGALAGGLMLGVAEAVMSGYGAAAYADVVAFVVLLAILTLRPTGMLGTSRAVRT